MQWRNITSVKAPEQQRRHRTSSVTRVGVVAADVSVTPFARAAFAV